MRIKGKFGTRKTILKNYLTGTAVPVYLVTSDGNHGTRAAGNTATANQISTLTTE